MREVSQSSVAKKTYERVHERVERSESVELSEC